MSAKVNSFRVSFRVVDASGSPIPTLDVGAPSQELHDIQAGGSVTVTVPVTNRAGQPTQTINDAVPGWVEGERNIVTDAAVDTAVAIAAGETKDVAVRFVARTDAVLGDEAAYDVDLVAA